MQWRGDGARQSRSRTQTVRAAAAGAPRAYATEHCASGCGDAPPARPGGGGAGLERVRGPADGVATIPGAHTRAIRGVCALITFICIARTASAGAWSGEWRSRSWSGAGCARPLLPAASDPPPVPRCERLRRRWAQEEVFIVGRGSPSLVGTVGTWCGALRAPSAGQAFARAGAHRCRPQPRAGTGPSATSESRTSSREEPAARQTQLLAATRSLTWCCACRSPLAPRCGNERSGCGQASTVRAMHTRAVPEPRSLTRRCWLARSPRGRRSGSGSLAGAHRRAASLLVERGAPACKIVACETGTAASCRGGARSRRRAGECAQA